MRIKGATLLCFRFAKAIGVALVIRHDEDHKNALW